jgi:hypothetical protein
MPVLLRKMLGIGALPTDDRDAVADETIWHLAEFVPVTFRFSGHVPGKVAKGNLRSYVGALAVTDRRLLGTLSSGPKKAVKTVDQLWSAPAGTMVHASIDSSGVLLDVPDMSVIGRCFTGSMSLRYKTALPDALLEQLPQRELVFDVPQKYVYLACGMPRPLS